VGMADAARHGGFAARHQCGIGQVELSLHGDPSFLHGQALLSGVTVL
jgi:hypothetical protein